MNLVIDGLIMQHARRAWGSVVVKALRYYSNGPGVTGDFFRGSPDKIMCPEVDSSSESEYQGFSWGKVGR